MLKPPILGHHTHAVFWRHTRISKSFPPLILCFIFNSSQRGVVVLLSSVCVCRSSETPTAFLSFSCSGSPPSLRFSKEAQDDPHCRSSPARLLALYHQAVVDWMQSWRQKSEMSGTGLNRHDSTSLLCSGLCLWLWLWLSLGSSVVVTFYRLACKQVESHLLDLLSVSRGYRRRRSKTIEVAKCRFARALR